MVQSACARTTGTTSPSGAIAGDVPQMLRRNRNVTGIELLGHRGLDCPSDLKLAQWRGTFARVPVRPRTDYHTLKILLSGHIVSHAKEERCKGPGTIVLRPCYSEGTFSTLKGGAQYLHLYLGKDAMRRLAEEITDRPVDDAVFQEVDAFTDAALSALLEQCVTTLCTAEPVSRLELDAWAQVIGAQLLRRFALERTEREILPESLSAAILARTVEFVESALDENLSVERLASAAGLAPYRFARAFKHSTGRTPHQFVLDRRVARAREMLMRTEECIAAIAYATGFASQAHMTDVFRKRLGTTPGRLRRG